MNLGKRVESERQARDWSQPKLVQLVNAQRLTAESGATLSQQALDRLEKRDSKTSDFAPQLADALGVSLRWLLTGEGRKNDLDWPFDRVDRRRWAGCSEADRGYVQAGINRALDECESGMVRRPAFALADQAAVPQAVLDIWTHLDPAGRDTWLREGLALQPLRSQLQLESVGKQ